MNICLVTPYFGNKEHKNSGIANHFNVLAEELVKTNNLVVLHIWANDSEDSSVKRTDKGILWIEKRIKSRFIRKLFKN